MEIKDTINYDECKYFSQKYSIDTFSYYWEMNGQLFSPSGNDGRIAIQPGVGTLIFARPLERDEAIYQCFADNGVGIALSVKVDLRKAGV